MIIKKLMKAFSAILFAVMATGKVAWAEPMTIHGVNTKMNFIELLGRLRDRSSRCSEPEKRKNSEHLMGSDQMVHYCWSKNIGQDDDSDITYIVSVDSGLLSILFECTATKTCEVGTYGVVHGLMEEGILPKTDDLKIQGGVFSYVAGDGHGLMVVEIGHKPYIQIFSTTPPSGGYDF